MVDVLEKIVKAVFFPYLFILICSLLLFCKKKEIKKTVICFSVILFMVLWRGLFIISSSRYCAAFIFFVILAVSYVFHEIKLSHNSMLILFIGLVFLIINIMKNNSSYQNNYINDAKEYLIKTSPRNDDLFFFYKKDFRRFQSNETAANAIVKDSITRDSINDLCKEYDWWGRKAFIVAQEKNESNRIEVLKQGFIKYYPLFKANTNKNRTKFCTIGLIQPEKKVDLPVSSDRFQELTQDTPSQKSVLKAYDPEYNIYVYQTKDDLVWFIDETKISRRVLIFNHINTTRPDLLPPDRIKHKFDNLGFHLGDKTKIDKIGCFGIYKSPLSKVYPITTIHIGYKDANGIMWEQSFSLTSI